MSVIELLLIVLYVFQKHINWIFGIGINWLLLGGSVSFAFIVILLSVWSKSRSYSKRIMYAESFFISINCVGILTIGIINSSLGIRKISLLEKIIFFLVIGLLIILNLRKGRINKKQNIKEDFLRETSICWILILFFLLAGLSIAISLSQLLSIKYLYFSSFIFWGILIYLYYRLEKMKERTLKREKLNLIKFQVFDIIISSIFYLTVMIWISSLLIFYFPYYFNWINIWFPLIAVSCTLLIILKSYKENIKRYDKEIIIFSWMLCVISFIFIFIMTIQKKIWGTYTGLKVILGAIYGIDAIILLTLKQKDVFINNLEKDSSLIKKSNGELIAKEIELFLGNITILFTFVNVIFYNDTITQKIIKILSPFLENTVPQFLYYINKIDNYIKIIALTIIIIFLTFIFALFLLFIEEYICKKLFFKKNIPKSDITDESKE